MFLRYLFPQLLLCFFAAASPCKADLITYTYTGFPFTNFMGIFPPMTGSITVSCPGVCVGTYTEFENIKLSAGFTLDTSTSAYPNFPTRGYIWGGWNGRKLGSNLKSSHRPVS